MSGENKTRGAPKGKKQVWNEFDCPECDANNPWPNEFGLRDEVFCQWCGQGFVVRKKNEDEYKLIAT